MTTAISIRAVRHADVDALSSTARRLFVQTYGNGPNAADMAAHIEEYFGVLTIAGEMRKPEVRYLLAFDADDLAGFAKFRRVAVPDAVPASVATEVQQLYVDAARQRKGIGRQLMDQVVASVAATDDEGIWLSVWQEADWAIRFYESYGFRRVGTEEFRLGRTRYMDFLMWLPVARAS